MKRIPLTQGQFAIVDDEDFDRLNQHKWCAYWRQSTKSFYATRRGRRENGEKYSVQMAREILGLGHGDSGQTDHIDHNTLDNRKSNIRVVTLQENAWNRKNSKGYYWNKAKRQYQAQIGINGVTIYLGRFCTASGAHNAYLEAKAKYHKIKVAS